MKENKKTGEAKKKPSHSTLSNSVWVSRLILRYASSLFAFMLLLVPVGLAQSYFGIYLPKLAVQLVVNDASRQTALNSLALCLGTMLVLSLITNGFGTVMYGFSTGLANEMQVMLAKKALTTDYMNLESPKFKGLLSRGATALNMNGNNTPMSQLVQDGFDLVQSVLGYLLFGAIISIINPLIALALTFTPLINFFLNRIYNKYEYANRDNWTPIDRKLRYIQWKSSDFSVAKDIRLYGLGGWFRETLRTLLKERRFWDRKLIYHSLPSALVNLLIILLRDGAAYAILIVKALRGEITVDNFLLCFGAISSFSGFVGGIFSKWNNIHSTSLTVCDLRDTLEYPEKQNRGEGVSVDGIAKPCEICLDNVSFRYEGAEGDTLKNITLKIAPGERLAVVGLNGAGKTTLVKIICGLYTPGEGTVSVSGHKVGEYNIRDYYSLFSAVFQDFYPLPVSIAETVSSKSREDTDDKRVRECLSLAGLLEKVDSLPDGINTPLNKQLNENGAELSGGETQKLMLAKAIYKNAEVLILDEPTAALDPIAENKMYMQYNELTRGKSAIYISHRLSSTRFCDRIVLIEDGRIAEEGTHASLMALGGKYAEMFELQSHYYKEGSVKNDENDAL